MRPFAKCEKIQQFCYIISSAKSSVSPLVDISQHSQEPYVRITTLLPEARTNRSALFLNNSPLISDGLRCAHTANELLYFVQRQP